MNVSSLYEVHTVFLSLSHVFNQDDLELRRIAQFNESSHPFFNTHYKRLQLLQYNMSLLLDENDGVWDDLLMDQL